MRDRVNILITILAFLILTLFVGMVIEKVNSGLSSCEYQSEKIRDKISKCMSLDETYNLCCFDRDGEPYDCRNRTVFNCGDEIAITVNLKNSDLPNKFFLCERYTKLKGSEYFECFNLLAKDDKNNNEISLCYKYELGNENLPITFNYGIIPNVNDKIVLMETYVFNDTDKDVEYFLNTLSKNESIFDIEVDVTC